MSIFYETDSLLKRRFYFAPGVSGLRDWKFYLAFLLQLVAVVMLASDPWFGRYGFGMRYNFLIFALALVSVASLAWESVLFGRPRGANLFLQLSFLIPFNVFLYRIFEQSPMAHQGNSLLDGFFALGRSLVNFSGIAKLVPQFVIDIFSNPMLLAVLLVVLFAMCFKSASVRLGAVLLVLAFFTGSAFFAPEGNRLLFSGGTLALAAAAALQFYPYRKVALYRAVLDALEPINDPKAYRTELKITLETCRRGQLSESGAIGVVREEMPDADMRTVNILASSRIGDLLSRRKVVVLESAEGGTLFLRPAPGLGSIDCPLVGAATLPRVLFLTLIAVLWVLSPIDLVPDAIPFWGVLDDVAISFLTMSSLRNATMPKL